MPLLAKPLAVLLGIAAAGLLVSGQGPHDRAGPRRGEQLRLLLHILEADSRIGHAGGTGHRPDRAGRR